MIETDGASPPVAGSVAWVQLYNEDDLVNSPSRADGISLQDELKERARMVDHIVTLGKRLRFPEVGIATACVYFHHYYMRNSLKQHDVFHVSSACLHLASKAEECRRFPRDIVSVTWQQRNPHRDVPHKDTHEYKNLVNAMLGEEVRVLQALEYSFATVHPNQFVLAAVKKLFPRVNERDRWTLCHFAWSIGNQSFRMPLCMFYPPQHIGLAIVELAVRWHTAECQANSTPPVFAFHPNWFHEFDPRVPVSVLSTISSNILLSLMDVNLAKHLREKESHFPRKSPSEINATSPPESPNASNNTSAESIDLTDEAAAATKSGDDTSKAEIPAASQASGAMDTSNDNEANVVTHEQQSSTGTPTSVSKTTSAADAMEIESGKEEAADSKSQSVDSKDSLVKDGMNTSSNDIDEKS